MKDLQSLQKLHYRQIPKLGGGPRPGPQHERSLGQKAAFG